MELINNRPVIISMGVGDWYPVGIDRLERSLIFEGYAGDMIFHRELPEGWRSHSENPYGFKIDAFDEAFNANRIALWLDASFWAIKNPHPIFDIINERGIFAFKTGYNCAQTCSDKALQWAGFSRDEAEKLPEIASGAVGLNIENPNGKRMFELWKEGRDLGLFKTNRLKDPKDSADPRFVHARQDQSILSLAIHKLGIKFDYQDYVAYYGSGFNKEKCLFFICGL